MSKSIFKKVSKFCGAKVGINREKGKYRRSYLCRALLSCSSAARNLFSHCFSLQYDGPSVGCHAFDGEVDVFASRVVPEIYGGLSVFVGLHCGVPV